MIIPFCNVGSSGSSPIPPEMIDPDDVTDMMARYRGVDLVGVDTAEITAWDDASPVGNDLVAVGSGGDRPTIKDNGINTTMRVAANAAARGLIKTSFTPPTSLSNWTLFSVVKFTALPAPSGNNYRNNFFAFDDSATNGLALGIRDEIDDGQLNILVAGVENGVTNEIMDLGWHVITMRCTADVYTVYVDGVLQTWEAEPSNPPTGTINSLSLLMGRDNSSVDFSFHELAEAILYDQAVSDGDRAGVETWLADHYGL